MRFLAEVNKLSNYPSLPLALSYNYNQHLMPVSSLDRRLNSVTHACHCINCWLPSTPTVVVARHLNCIQTKNGKMQMRLPSFLKPQEEDALYLAYVMFYTKIKTVQHCHQAEPNLHLSTVLGLENLILILNEHLIFFCQLYTWIKFLLHYLFLIVVVNSPFSCIVDMALNPK